MIIFLFIFLGWALISADRDHYAESEGSIYIMPYRRVSKDIGALPQMNPALEQVVFAMVKNVLIREDLRALDVLTKLLRSPQEVSCSSLLYENMVRSDERNQEVFLDGERERLSAALNSVLFDGDKRTAEILLCILKNCELPVYFFSERGSSAFRIRQWRERWLFDGLKSMAVRLQSFSRGSSSKSNF